MAAYETQKAIYSGICPICCHGIAKSSSSISALVVATPINPAFARFYAERGAWLIHDQYVERLHRRKWAHQKCCDALDAKYGYDEQVAMAEEWHAELVAMKRAAIRIEGRQNGRKRRARSKATRPAA